MWQTTVYQCCKMSPLHYHYELMGWDEETYYWAMTPERAERVVTQHVKQDQVVTDFLGDPSKEPPK